MTILDCMMLSTGHITAEDFDFLVECENRDALTWIEKQNPAQGYGLWLFCGMEEIDEAILERPAIARVVEYAQAHDCLYVRFTNAEEPVSDLPFYDWDQSNVSRDAEGSSNG